MGKLIYHLDDAAAACEVAGTTILQKVQDAELKQYQEARSFFQSLESSQDVPWIILCDIDMPNVSGSDVLSILKRHSRFHFAPVVMLASTQNPEEQASLMKSGAFDCILKPMTASSLEALLAKRRKIDENYEACIELDKNFAEEVADLLGNAQNISTGAPLGLDEAKLNELYRIFHTIKGGANALAFPMLGNFVHEVETVLSAVKSANLYNFPRIFDLLGRTINYLQDQCEFIRERKLLLKPSDELTQEIRTLRQQISSGQISQIHQNAQVSLSGQANGAAPATLHPTAGIVSRTQSSVRITNERLNELQQHFKKILTTKLKINGFAQQLKSEFFDEKFPDQLVKLVDTLNDSSLAIMDFFIQLRVVPASRLKTFAQQVLSQATHALGKSATFEFQCSERLEVDLPIMECLENAMTHLIRNAVDHGLESAPDRLRAGKSAEGRLILKIEHSDSSTDIKVILSDDGQGIHAQKLRDVVSKKSLVAGDVLKTMSDEEACHLIFLDGLSTKDEVSDISGRGVGLSAVKQQIEDMGGKITVSSRSGEGSEFVIQIPRIFHL